MRNNVDKVLERDAKLGDLEDRAGKIHYFEVLIVLAIP